MEFLRARREKRYALIINDPRPVESIADIWDSSAQAALVGIFLLLLGAGFYFSRAILLPVLAALVVGMTLAPLIKRARNCGVSPWATSGVLVLLLIAAGALMVTALATPVAEWIGRAPEIGNIIKQKIYFLDWPISALRELQDALMPAAAPTVALEQSQVSVVAPVVAFATPAVAEMALFIGTLFFFLAEQMSFRRYVATLFASREGKLRFLRIASDIEENLATYLATVTAINCTLGVVVGVGAWLFGFPNAPIFGILAAVLNYLPYIGPAAMAVVLFGVGLVSFPSLGHALLPPACFVALTTLEGQIVTPTVLGQRLTLNPLVIFLSLAFWAWLWGPMGAFLAVPLSIIGLVVFGHMFPGDDPKLPD